MSTENKEQDLLKIAFPPKAKHEYEGFRFISEEDENELDSLGMELIEFLDETYGTILPEEKQDELYSKSQEMWHKYKEALDKTEFGVVLNKEDHSFLKNTLTKKMEYDVDTVFFLMEVSNRLLSFSDDNVFEDEKESRVFNFKPTELSYTYHLFSKYKVKGLVKETYNFHSTAIAFGRTSMVFNYYENVSKVLANAITEWVSSFKDA